MTILEQLKQPFPAADIEWRVDRAGTKGDGTVWCKVVPYVDARAVTERLDQVCGNTWYMHQAAVHGENHRLEGFLCTLMILGDDGERSHREDGSECTDFQGFKGGLSGALRRAAALWGIGKYLYKLGEAWADTSTQRQDDSWHFARGTAGKHPDFYWRPPQLPAWALPEGTAADATDVSRQQQPAAAGATAPPANTAPPAAPAADGTIMPDCPVCHTNLSVIKGREDWGGGWTCWAKSKKRTGCGAKWGTTNGKDTVGPQANGKQEFEGTARKLFGGGENPKDAVSAKSLIATHIENMVVATDAKKCQGEIDFYATQGTISAGDAFDLQDAIAKRLTTIAEQGFTPNATGQTNREPVGATLDNRF